MKEPVHLTVTVIFYQISHETHMIPSSCIAGWEAGSSKRGSKTELGELYGSAMSAQCKSRPGVHGVIGTNEGTLCRFGGKNKTSSSHHAVMLYLNLKFAQKDLKFIQYGTLWEFVHPLW